MRDALAAERITDRHPAACMAEAQAFGDAGPDDPRLVDRTDLPFVTIDEFTSKDLDQAVFVESVGEGHVVWYAIADASWFVRPGSALWDEALRRGASFYVPGLVCPMLPRLLSEDRISINAEVDRRALLFRMELDGGGNCTGTTIERARVRSRAKLAFSQVQDFLDGKGAPSPDPAVQASLRAIEVVGKRRVELAYHRHVIRYRRREMTVQADGTKFVAFADDRLPIELWNEQISLLCNREGAWFLKQRSDQPWVQPIYRVHHPMDGDAVESLRRRIDGLVKTHRLPELFRFEPTRDRLGAYLDRLPTDGREGRIARAIHRQAMIAGGPAEFTSVPGGHHGVGADVYGRFTAPMREVVGIFSHEEICEAVAGADVEHSSGVADDDTTRAAVIEASNRAHVVQKRLEQVINRCALDDLLAPAFRDGATFVGTVMGISEGKVHVQLDGPPIDAKVYIPRLESRHGRMFVQSDGNGLRLRQGDAPIALIGDAVQIRVVGGQPGRDRWDLDLQRVTTGA